MVYKYSFLKVSLLLCHLLMVNFFYSQNIQNPDGKLTFNLKDNDKDIKFNPIKYSYNNELEVYDSSNLYSIKIKGLNSDNSHSNTNLELYSKKGIDCFYLKIGWSGKVIVEILKKETTKIDTMTILFDNIFQSYSTTEINFKKGNYIVNIQEVLEATKTLEKKEYSTNNLYIDPKYFKKTKFIKH